MENENFDDDFVNGLDLVIPTVRNRSEVLFTIVSELEKESDRGCALVAAVYLENEIRALLMSFFVEQGSSTIKELFDFNGPLGTFSSKIKICFALGLISKETQTSLNGIRNIRNEFAHLQAPLNFMDMKIQQKIDSLLPSHEIHEISARETFIKKVQTLVAVIHLSLANTFNRQELKHENVPLLGNQDDHEIEITARTLMKASVPEITYEQALSLAHQLRELE